MDILNTILHEHEWGPRAYYEMDICIWCGITREEDYDQRLEFITQKGSEG